LAKLGFLVNPVAGMGGAVGLKGTDGTRTLREARKRGATPVSPRRAHEFLERFVQMGQSVELLVAPGAMGVEIAKGVRIKFETLGRVVGNTRSKDTIRVSRLMKRHKVDLLVFCGGDGTARDVYEAVGDGLPVLGVPAGVKVYSSVFAITPAAAAETVHGFLAGNVPTRKGEVLDIDEKMFRKNVLSVKLHGYLTTPDYGYLIQSSKSVTPGSEADEIEAMAKGVHEEMNPGTTYVLGPGTTVEAIARKLGVEKTLLGVDVVKGDGTVIARDVDEAQLAKLVEKKPVKIIVSPIGGQGFLFGRGNQQISARVLRSVGVENVIAVASKMKIATLQPRRLLVDTGDAELDKMLRGYRRVVTGYMEEIVVKVE
jgi:predicted polyphosphate/ATP-dependent NAD kinase